MPIVQADIDALEAILKSGARRTSFTAGDTSRTVEFHSPRELQDIIDRWKASLPA